MEDKSYRCNLRFTEEIGVMGVEGVIRCDVGSYYAERISVLSVFIKGVVVRGIRVFRRVLVEFLNFKDK